VTGLRAMAAADGVVIPAESLGKFKVGAQVTAVLSFILSYPIGMEWPSTSARARSGSR